MRYFRLFPDCRLICGPARAKLYFFTRKKTYHFSKVQSNILAALVGNGDVETVIENHGDEARQLLTMLIKEGLGTFHERPVATELYQPKSLTEGMRGIFEPPPVISGLFLEITDACDGKCDFCGNNDLYQCWGCNCCIRWPHRGVRRAAAEDMNKALNELRDLHIYTVVISGGNPLMESERLFTLAGTLREAKPNITIVVNCNGGHLDHELGKKLKALDIRVMFSVFGASPQEYGAITGVPELYSQLQSAVTLCKELEIKYDITLVIPPVARNRRNELHEFGLSLGGERLFFTELLSKYDNSMKIVSSPTGPSKMKSVGTEEFFWREKNHSCLAGKMAIALDGSVLPCPSWLAPIDSICSGKGIRPLFHVFEPGIFDYWETPKALIPGCKDCESRYACTDCAVLEWETNRDIVERRRYCDYVPELGVWRESVE